MSQYDNDDSILSNIYFYIVTTHCKILKNYMICDNPKDMSSDITTKLNCLANNFYNSSINFDLNTNNNVQQYTIKLDDRNLKCIEYINYDFIISEKLSELLKCSKPFDIENYLIKTKNILIEENTLIVNFLQEMKKKENELILLKKTIDDINAEHKKTIDGINIEHKKTIDNIDIEYKKIIDYIDENNTTALYDIYFYSFLCFCGFLYDIFV